MNICKLIYFTLDEYLCCGYLKLLDEWYCRVYVLLLLE